jgi:hypothetical protein
MEVVSSDRFRRKILVLLGSRAFLPPAGGAAGASVAMPSTTLAPAADLNFISVSSDDFAISSFLGWGVAAFSLLAGEDDELNLVLPIPDLRTPLCWP